LASYALLYRGSSLLWPISWPVLASLVYYVWWTPEFLLLLLFSRRHSDRTTIVLGLLLAAHFAIVGAYMWPFRKHPTYARVFATIIESLFFAIVITIVASGALRSALLAYTLILRQIATGSTHLRMRLVSRLVADFSYLVEIFKEFIVPLRAGDLEQHFAELPCLLWHEW
jgi:hypothetical protein